MNLAPLAGKGEAFAPLADIDYFCRMKVDPKFRTIEWPNGADLSPESLYETVKKSGAAVATYELGV